MDDIISATEGYHQYCVEVCDLFCLHCNEHLLRWWRYPPGNENIPPQNWTSLNALIIALTCWYWTLSIALDTRHEEWLYRKRELSFEPVKRTMRPYWPIQISVDSKCKIFQGCSVYVFALDQCSSSTNLYVYGSISLGARTLQNSGIFPNWTTNISKSNSITKFNTTHFASERNQDDLILTSCPTLAALSRTKRTIWWRNGSFARKGNKSNRVWTQEVGVLSYRVIRWRTNL